mgnify:CR=1 FL=1
MSYDKEIKAKDDDDDEEERYVARALPLPPLVHLLQLLLECPSAGMVLFSLPASLSLLFS